MLTLAGLLLACQPPGPVDEPWPQGSGAFDRTGPPGYAQAIHSKVEHRLYGVFMAARKQGLPAAALLAAKTGVRLRGAEVLVQINLSQGRRVDEITDQDLARFGARVAYRGTSVIDAQVPIWQVPALAVHLEAAATLGAPLFAKPDTGAIVSQGVALTDADKYGCRKITGKGIHLAVLDAGFSSWSAVKAAGELPLVSGTPAPGSTAHGTSVAEVIADMAPGVTIHPVTVSTRAAMESWVKNSLPGSGVKIINRSLSSLGGGFDDGTGAWCNLAKQIKAAGALWVNSAGNMGGGTAYRADFADADTDKWHDFAAGDEHNEFTIYPSLQIQIQLDWDDWPASGEDFDLFLYRLEGGAWVQVASSTSVQTGTQKPLEFISLNGPKDGTYAVGIYRKAGVKSKVPLRLQLVAGNGTFKHNTKASSLNTAAACADVLAVGAVQFNKYTSGPQYDSSSRGPTWDGRVKPEIVAPTQVTTASKNSFGGTSAAAPHVAAAVALYMEATGKDALAAAKLVVQDATAMGSPVPNNIYGGGRLEVDTARAGWQCKLGASQSCVTSCSSSGTRTCDQTCAWNACQPPVEICNGKDDDCDGTADDGFACVAGGSVPCTTTCGSTGQKTCAATTCTLSSCQAPLETCNGKDDDCDGKIDEDGICPGPDGGLDSKAKVDAWVPTGNTTGCSCELGGPPGAGSAAALVMVLLLGIRTTVRRTGRRR